MQILSELKEYAQSNNVPIVEDETIKFILDFIKNKKVTSILEIGTAIGYSALYMSTIDCVNRILSLEKNYGLFQIAQANIKRAEKSEIIEVINVDALKYPIQEKFDLLFIDGAKAQYKNFFDHCINFVEYVIVDNIDFHGLVKDPSLTTNRNTKALIRKIIEFKEVMMEDENYDCRYFEKGDGILLIRKH